MRKRTRRTEWVCLNPVDHAIYQASTLTPAEWNRQITPLVVAIEQLAQGAWMPRDNWSNVFEALNRIETIVKLKHIDDSGLIERGKATFISALDREAATGATAFKAAELETIREIGEVYGDLLREISHRDLKIVCDKTKANVDRITRQRKEDETVHAGCVIETTATRKQGKKGKS